MYFLKRDFPFVMAFFAINGYHGIKGCSRMKPELFGIFDGFFQVLVTIHQQVTGNVLGCGAQVKRYQKRLGIPVSAAAIFLAGKAFRTNIEPLVLTGVGLVEVKDIKANTLLRRLVALDDDVAVQPLLIPCIGMLFKEGVVFPLKSFLSYPTAVYCNFTGGGVVERT